MFGRLMLDNVLRAQYPTKKHPAMVVPTNNIKDPAAEDVLYKKDVRS